METRNFCNFCGAKLEPHAKFCPKCGTHPDDASQSSDSTSMPPINSSPSPQPTWSYGHINSPAPNQPNSSMSPSYNQTSNYSDGNTNYSQYTNQNQYQNGNPNQQYQNQSYPNQNLPPLISKPKSSPYTTSSGSNIVDHISREEVYDNWETIITYTDGRKVKIADEGMRLFAFLIDYFLIGSIMGILISIDTFLIFPSIFISYLYFGLFETITNGRTLGKLIFGLKTLDHRTYDSPSVRQTWIQALGKVIVPLDIILGLISRSQEDKNLGIVRITQKWADVVVVKKI